MGIWIRVSTDLQVRDESPEVHERRARLYAEAKGWAVAEVYRLDTVSGKAVMGHPEARRMVADVRSGRITGLIFSKLARLARNTVHNILFLTPICRSHIYKDILHNLKERSIHSRRISSSLPYTRLLVAALADNKDGKPVCF